MACPSCGQCPVSTPPSLFVFWIAARRRQEIHLMNHYSDPLNIHLTYSLCKTAWPSHRITELGSLHLHIYLYFSVEWWRDYWTDSDVIEQSGVTERYLANAIIQINQSEDSTGWVKKKWDLKKYVYCSEAIKIKQIKF